MQAEPMMVDPYLHSELKPNEQLLWWGKPDPAHRVKTGNTQIVSIVIYSVMALASAGLLLFGIRLAIEENALFGVDGTTITLLIISLALLCLHTYRLSVLYKRHVQYITNLRNTVYGITNQRVIVMTASTPNFIVHSFGSGDMGPINRIETGGGWGDVSYGKARQVQRGMVMVTIVEKLIGIPNARMVEDLLVRTFKTPVPSAPQAFYPPQTPPFPQPYPPLAQQYMPSQPQE